MPVVGRIRSGSDGSSQLHQADIPSEGLVIGTQPGQTVHMLRDNLALLLGVPM